MNTESDGVANSAVCAHVRSLLSDYTDSSLSGRDTWVVEKHLAGCEPCGLFARELQATVDLLRRAPRLDTSEHFMASLHERLDAVEPAAQDRSGWWRRMAAWLSGGNAPRFGGRAPALTLCAAMAALVVLFAINRPGDPQDAAAQALTASDSAQLSMAASAGNPFSDPAADNLEMRAGARNATAPSPF